MKFTTTRFGAIEFSEDVTLAFPDGILGFPDGTRYILLEHSVEGSPFRWLQSLDNPDLAFIVVDPLMIDPRFRIEIDQDSARSIATDDPAECALIAIVNVPRDNPAAMTANLKAPIAINAANRRGRQLILSTNAYSISTPVFPAMNEALEGANGHGDYAHPRAASA